MRKRTETESLIGRDSDGSPVSQILLATIDLTTGVKISSAILRIAGYLLKTLGTIA